MIGVFIDGAHFSICWNQVSSKQVDFAKLLSCIESKLDDTISEAYCFDATVSGSTNAYFKALQRSGIRVKLYEFAHELVFGENRRPIIDPATGQQAQRRIQKGVDVGLTMHMLDSHARRGWSRLVLAASDADFAEPVQRLVEVHNVELVTLGLPEKTSYSIRAYAARRLDLREMAESIARPVFEPVSTVVA